jgi:N-acyl-D-amino-acid deacylase
MREVLIRNGTIVDGTGRPSFKADLLIEGDRIARIGEALESTAAGRVVDATGLIVAPGFLDMHSHSDLTLWAQGGAESALCQGVTTEVIGNCGFSCYPVHPERLKMLEHYLAGMGYDGSHPMPWRDLDGYADHLEQRSIAVNAVPLVGHGAIRIAVMGFDAREATRREQGEMACLLQTALDEGAFGMSSGLVYPPGINAPPEELEALCTVVARAGGLHATHLRGDGLRAGPSLVDSLEEALHTARATGVSLQVSHVAPKFPNQGVADRVIERMERARQEGLNVGCDIHPYKAAMTFLASLMPPWFFEGGADESMRRLADPGERGRLREALHTQFDHLGWEEFWSRSQPLLRDPSSPFHGKRFHEMAQEARKDASEVLLDILHGEGADVFRAAVLMWIYTPEDTLRTFLWDHTMIGADGVSSSPEAASELMSLHPRSWGSFPAAIRQFAREGGHVSLEEAVRRMSSLPAAMLGLRDRGILAEGKHADVVVFDPTRFADKGTYENARQFAEGMAWVFVNGEVAMEDGVLTGTRGGRVLRRTK